MIYTSAAVAYRRLKFGWRQPGWFWNGIASLPESGGWPEVCRDTIHAYREGNADYGVEHGIMCAIEELTPYRMGLAVGDILRDEPLPMGIESLAGWVNDRPVGLAADVLRALGVLS